jgi:hypothetical protein
MSKHLSFEDAKKLYLQKMEAIIFLENLRNQHPELFDKRYLYEMLQHELKLQSEQLSPSVEMKILEAIKKIERQH